METNGASNVANTRAQPSIRSFFQPRQPNYTPPPGSSAPKVQPQVPSPLVTQTPPSLPSQVSAISHEPITSTSKSHLPPQATISQIEQPHIQPLRRINALLLPITYPDSFYHKILLPDSPTPAPPRSFSRSILWTDTSSQDTKVIGGVICRVDPSLSPSSTPQNPSYTPNSHDIYIQSLCLLSPYRGQGIVAAVLNEVIEAAVSQSELSIESLYAHVWTQNEEALEWYAARGFKMEEAVIKGYYRVLNPDSAYILRRKLVPSDHLNGHTQPQARPGITKQLSAPVSQPLTPIAPGRPPMPIHARSFQDAGPEREWNDLPDDVLGGGLLKPPSALASREGSAPSSRSSSRSGADLKGKKKRVYPAAAFGS
ncbi:hypothetical protein WAI453_002256 [Rhynchosporium graminicola]|uniref:N-acetyltransferase domain-containing protein n=1 Tax=Rhynchosporium graminicola TaxID=2792576 RepID=A0A1E1LC46_9HELO|nr:uncharacterized protein RCO7_09559 [Rhynchosporium commune]